METTCSWTRHFPRLSSHAKWGQSQPNISVYLSCAVVGWGKKRKKSDRRVSDITNGLLMGCFEACWHRVRFFWSKERGNSGGRLEPWMS